jgi:hypothetical protein
VLFQEKLHGVRVVEDLGGRGQGRERLTRGKTTRGEGAGKTYADGLRWPEPEAKAGLWVLGSELFEQLHVDFWVGVLVERAATGGAAHHTLGAAWREAAPRGRWTPTREGT